MNKTKLERLLEIAHQNPKSALRGLALLDIVEEIGLIDSAAEFFLDHFEEASDFYDSVGALDKDVIESLMGLHGGY